MSLAHLLAVNDCIYGGKAVAEPRRTRRRAPPLASAAPAGGQGSSAAYTLETAVHTRISGAVAPAPRRWRLALIALLTLLCLGACSLGRSARVVPYHSPVIAAQWSP